MTSISKITISTRRIGKSINVPIVKLWPLFALPFLMIAEFSLVGRLTGADLGCMLVVIILAFRAGPKASPEELRFYILAALWLLGAVASDLIRETLFEQYARGWSKIIFFAVNFTAIRWLIKGNILYAAIFVYILLIASAVKVSLGIGENLDISNGAFEGGWKFGYGQLFSGTVLLISAALISSSVTRLLGIVISFAPSFLSLVWNARNLFGISALAALIMALTAGRKRPLSGAAIGAVGLVGIFAGGLLLSVYAYTASHGLLGVEAQNKYEQQTQGDLGIILGGRSESLASTQAIIDSPIIGHGSWARDSKYADVLALRLEEAGGEFDDLIPTHSHLFGAWVEAGILGAIFWIWAMWITAKGLVAAIRRPTPMTGFIAFIGISLAWDILFSPFGLDRRITTTASLYLMMLLAKKYPIQMSTAHGMELSYSGQPH